MFVNQLFYFFNLNTHLLFSFLNSLDPFYLNGSHFFNFEFVQNSTFVFGCKFLLCIAFLILIRGGTPRYRYDYLTKLGWLKFLSFVISIFFLALLFIFIQ